MSYPILRVHRSAIRENGESLISECSKNGVSLWGVSKGISAFPEIAATYKEAGFKVIADSRLANISKMKKAGIDCSYALIRIPMRSELEDLVELADYSLVSDLGTIQALSEICARRKKEHKCVVMFDMGDLREGFWATDIDEMIPRFAKLNPWLKIAGVGANFSCASGVLPSRQNLNQLISFGEALEPALGYELEIYSGGGTCSFVQMQRGNLPSKINELRIGEALLLGVDTSFNITIDTLRQDTMEVEAELVEVRCKPTLPIGQIGRDAFGNVPVFEDRGNRMRGILAIGKQDVHISGLQPLDQGVKIITASSDHLLVDIEDCARCPQVGEILRFRPDYTAMLSSSTSPYVTKIFEG